MAGRELTAKQQLFVEALPVNNFNITAAALAAGYSESYAKDRICKVLKKPGLLTKAVDRVIKRTQDQLTDGWDLNTIAGKLRESYDRSVNVGNETAANTALQSLIRMQGGFIDRSHNINENIDYRPPTEPQERLQWLKQEVRLLERQLNAGTAIAGQDQLSFEKG